MRDSVEICIPPRQDSVGRVVYFDGAFVAASDVLVILREKFRELVDLPGIDRLQPVRPRELQAIFSLCYSHHKGADVPIEVKRSFYLLDYGAYERTGEIPYYVLRTCLRLPERAEVPRWLYDLYRAAVHMDASAAAIYDFESCRLLRDEYPRF